MYVLPCICVGQEKNVYTHLTNSHLAMRCLLCAALLLLLTIVLMADMTGEILCHIHQENMPKCWFVLVGPLRAGSEMSSVLACACTGVVAMVTTAHYLTRTTLRTSTHLHVCVGRQKKNYNTLKPQAHSVTAFPLLFVAFLSKQ